MNDHLIRVYRSPKHQQMEWIYDQKLFKRKRRNQEPTLMVEFGYEPMKIGG
jgi:hypothetical protein